MTEPTVDNRPAIAAAVIVTDDRVLLVRRRQAEGTVLWAFLAGTVENGETREEAASRATSELADLAWAEHGNLPVYVPHGFFPAVQDHLDTEIGP